MSSNAQNAPALLLRPIGAVGLGQMGIAVAANLLEDGYDLTVYKRDREYTIALGHAGALADLARCELVITSLPDDEALIAITLGPHGLVDNLTPDAIQVSTNTTSPGVSRRLAELHARTGQHYVAALVLGNPDLARTRNLFVLAFGAKAALDRAAPVLGCIGQRVFILGDDAGATNVMKFAGNVLTALAMRSMGEVLALLRKNGIEAEKEFDVLTRFLLDGKVHKAYGGKIVDERHTPGITVPLAVKDLRLALALAEAAVPMPAASVVHDRLVTITGRGWSELDWSGLGLLAAVDAARPGRTAVARSAA